MSWSSSEGQVSKAPGGVDGMEMSDEGALKDWLRMGYRSKLASNALCQGAPVSVTAGSPSLFKLIHGIVRQTDSLRRGRAQHMKSYGQIIEISC